MARVARTRTKKTATKTARARKTPSRRRKSRSISTPGPKPIRTKLTKRQMIDNLADRLDGAERIPELSPNARRKIVGIVLDGLGDMMIRSIMPGSAGEFMFPRMFKVATKVRKAIRKGTMVRNPGTGEMQPSQGRPASKRTVIRPLATLKKAALGETG